MNLLPNTEMLKRLGIGLELASYASAIFVLVSYAADSWIHNESYYKIEADYVKWVTNLPTYSVCPTVKNSFLSKQLKRMIKSNSSDVIHFVRGLINPGKKYCRRCDMDEIKSTFKSDLKTLVEIFSEPCENIFAECSWNGVPFQCCTLFQKIWSEEGACFSLNSPYSKEISFLDMTTSINKPKAELILKLTGSVKVHVHDGKSLDLPKNIPKIGRGSKVEIIYKFVEWTEDEDSWFLDKLLDKNCTLNKEAKIDGLDSYSRSLCKMRCKAQQQRKKCGCKHHSLPGREKDCDLQGLICLDKSIKLNGNDCDCLEECSKTEVRYIRYSIEKSQDKLSEIELKLSGPPTERMILTSKLTLIDLIVTTACLSRLITNKSLFHLIMDILIKTKALTPEIIYKTNGGNFYKNI